ncbi:MAG: hypothetical protein AB7O67_15115 [Vicinamibacterales bacterium]
MQDAKMVTMPVPFEAQEAPSLSPPLGRTLDAGAGLVLDGLRAHRGEAAVGCRSARGPWDTSLPAGDPAHDTSPARAGAIRLLGMSGALA